MLRTFLRMIFASKWGQQIQGFVVSEAVSVRIRILIVFCKLVPAFEENVIASNHNGYLILQQTDAAITQTNC